LFAAYASCPSSPVTPGIRSAFSRTARNVSKTVLKALKAQGGLLGLSLYPLHLAHGGETTLRQFGEMAVEAAQIIGVEHLGVGSDLCQSQPDSVVCWMREGRWTRVKDETVMFPPELERFGSNADFPAIADGLAAAGFEATEIGSVLGGSWRNFITTSF
jgi:microsomal dipeptidase-like Zn-dependent dipeptidase